MSEQVRIEWRGAPIEIESLTLDGPADRPLIVFLHEGLGSVSMWRDFPQALCSAARCRGLVYSRPGYGQSTPRAADDHWPVDFMHQQAYEVLPALLQALRIDEPVWLFGHSDGGSIALLYAAAFPHAVRGLVVLAPHILVEDLSIASIHETRDAYDTTDLKQKLARHHADVDSAFRGWNDIWLHADFRDWSIQAELPRITCPVLAIQGLDDPYGTLAQIHGIARHLPGTRLVELPDCGHSPHRDRPDAVIEAAVDFIQQSHSGDPT